jgi:DNA-binding Lrp family transcriptional regulator
LALVAALRAGLPVCPRPYATLGQGIGMSEAEVIGRLSRMRDSGVLRRFGAIVRHHEAGYGANAMVVLAPPEEEIPALGRRLAGEPAVTLCYRRAPAPPVWPYVLYCMIHGQSRDIVSRQIAGILIRHGLTDTPHKILFSRHRFKQTGGCYGRTLEAAS